MEEQEEEDSNYLEEENKGSYDIFKKIDEICEQYRNKTANKEIAEVDKWNISDFFGINDLERIKQTPEYIVEKILYKFKKFIDFNEYFFIMKPKEISEEDIENKKSVNEKDKEEKIKSEKKAKRKEKIEEDKKVNVLKENKEKESLEDNSSEKEKGKEKTSKKENEEKNQRKLLEGKGKVKKKEKEKEKKEEMKKKSKKAEGSQKRIKKYKIKNPNEKRSNSMSIIPNLDSFKFNLNIHAEEENKKIYNFNIKRSNSLFDKKNINNSIQNIKSFIDYSDSKSQDKSLYKKKDFTDDKEDSQKNGKNKFENNSSNFSLQNNSLSINNINSSNELSLKIKDNLSISKNKLENNLINISSKNNSSSAFYNFQYSESIVQNNIDNDKNNENDKTKGKKDTYILRFFKNKLNLEEEENLSGHAYEEYARKTIKLMYVLSLKTVPTFQNPKNISTEHIINFYKDSLKSGIIEKIDTPIYSSIFEETQKEKHFEIDIVYELTKKEIIKFVKKYDKIIFFKNHFLNENDKDINEKVTCYTEIARNLISQGKEKLEQIKKYIKIVKIMNNMRQFLSNLKNYKKILIPYHTSESTEKIFSIITDGNYEELQFVINKIVIPKLNGELNYTQIKEDIEMELKNNSKLFINVDNKNSLVDNIYYVFEIFYQLKINKIKFCLIYIGDICESTRDLTHVLIQLKNGNCLNQNGELLKDYVTKKNDRLLKLKNIYQEIKNKILEFEKKCEKYISFDKENIENILNKIDYNIYDYNCYISQIKFEYEAYIFYNNENEFLSSKKDYQNIISRFKKYFKFKINLYEINKDKIDLKNIFNYMKQGLYRINFIFFDAKILNIMFPYINKSGINIYSFQININPESQNNDFDTKKLLERMKIELKFREKINHDIKHNLPFHYEEQMLMPTNLESKLINDLNKIFKVNGNINIRNILEEIKFEIPKEKEDELIKYFDEIAETLEIKDISEIKNTFISNLKKLEQNLLSKHFYFIFIHKIGKYFRKKYEEGLGKVIENFNNSKKYSLV